MLLLHFLCDILVSDGDNFINTNTNYVPPHRVEDLCSDLYSNLYGLQTENNESKLIGIDRNYNINKFSKNMAKTKPTFVERKDCKWRPQYVYWSPANVDMQVV